MVLRSLFRLLTYPSLFYSFFVYYQAKSNDPEGFKALRIAFNIPEFSFDSFHPIEDNKDKNDNKDTNDKDDTQDTKYNIDGDHQLEYPKPAPKPKTIKPSINDMCQDLLELRQVLYDLATTCQFLQSQQPSHHPQKSKCFSNFPYYERPLNSKLLQNAHVYTSQIESSLAKIENIFGILKSSVISNSLSTDIIAFVKECGPACVPLAEILYKQPELPESEIQEIFNNYQARIDDIDQVLQASLHQSQTNILTAQTSKSLPTIKHSSPDLNSKTIHRTALTQINEHFEFLKEQNIITSERIDQTSLQNFAEFAKNIKFNV